MLLSHGKIELPPLEEFQATQLRELYISFFKSPENVPRSKVELIEKLSEQIDSVELQTLIGKLEATQAFKHIYLFAFERKNCKQDLLSALLNDTNFPVKVESTDLDLYVVGSHIQPYPTLRLAHSVMNKIPVSTGQDTFKLQTVTFRHAVVVAIKLDLGIVEVRFNGFEQSREVPKTERINYISIAESIRDFITQKLETPVKGLALKEAVNRLLSKYPDEVVQGKNVSRVGGGRVLIETFEGDDAPSFEEMFKTAFKSNQPSEVMEKWAAENITLRWKNLHVHTRIDFTPTTPEIYFLWKGSPMRSVEGSDQIVRRLVEFSEISYAKVRESISLALDDMGTNVFTPFELMQRAIAPYEDTLSFLLEQTSANKVAMRFRIRTNANLHNMTNHWRESLSDVPHEVTTEFEETIDTTDGKNVEVAFVKQAEGK
ncbi:hypothetical protein ACO0LL_20785 [Undibacterium sp. TC4M20W]|uniref:hypothetical protein n=1 Tax=Undibacterium sp. TC4M20W TaxID=3413052 RepID=UPI003BF0A03C